MARRLFGRGSDKSAAAAPTVALALFALIGSAGVAFDYARLAALDTELQAAADQAALAAATQLDRADGAMERAQDAISADDKDRLAENITRFANDGDDDGTTIELEDIVFCTDFDDSVEDTAAACEADDLDDQSARFVVVTTVVRSADYALTPIVGAFSGDASATAVAGIESQICNVAPLMVCVADDNFPTDEDIGRGIIMKVAGGEQWVPGNYGYLDFGNGNQAVLNALLGHGLNGCQSEDDNETEPGNKNATDAINTRMDVYDGTGSTNNPSVCETETGAGCPAENTRKDMTLEMTFEIRVAATAPKPTPPDCGEAEGGAVNSGGKTSYAEDFAENTDVRGFRRDTCHYSGSCPDGNFGDGSWDRDAYLTANHPGITADAVATAIGGEATGATLTRYQIYLWELANKVDGRLDPQQIGITTEDDPKPQGSNITYTFHKKCTFNEPKLASAAYPVQKDRRILPIVAANCDNLKGKGTAFEDYVILRVFDVLLTEPSLNRSTTEIGGGATVGTDDKEIYGEVIGPGDPVGEGSGFQYYTRSRPYLVR